MTGTTKPQGTQALDPFLAQLRGQKPQVGEDPFLAQLRSGSGSAAQEDLASSAIGRMTLEAQDKAEQRRKLQAILDDPKTTQGQKDRINRLFAVQDREQNSTAGNLVRGTLPGLGGGVMAAADYVGMAGQAVGQPGLRRQIQEATQVLREASGVDPNSTAGQVGEFAGNIVGAMPGLGSAARLTGMGIAKVAIKKELPTLAKVVTGAVEGSVAKRAAASAGANVLTGLPLSVASSMSTPEASTEDKVNNLMQQVGADALFGALFHASPTSAKAAREHLKAQIEGKVAPEMTASTEAPKSTNDELLAKLNSKAELDRVTREAAKNASDEAKRISRAQWQIENPKEVWSDLSKEQKKKITATYLEKNPPVVAPSAETAVPEAAPTGGMSSEQSADFIGGLAAEQSSTSLSVDQLQKNLFISLARQTDIGGMNPTFEADILSGKLSLDDAAAMFGEKPHNLTRYISETPEEIKNAWEFYKNANQESTSVQLSQAAIEFAASNKGIQLEPVTTPAQFKADLQNARDLRAVQKTLGKQSSPELDTSAPKIPGTNTPQELYADARAIALDPTRAPEVDVPGMQEVWSHMTVRERETALQATGKGARALRDLSKDNLWAALQADPERLDRLHEVLRPNIEARVAAQAAKAVELERIQNEAPTKLAEAQRPLVNQVAGELDQVQQATDADIGTLRQRVQDAARRSREEKSPVLRLRASEELMQLQKQLDQAQTRTQQALEPVQTKLADVQTTLDQVAPDAVKEPPQIPANRRGTPAGNLTNEELPAHKTRYEYDLAEATDMQDKAKQNTLIERIKRIDKEQKRRDDLNASGGGGPLLAQMPPELGGFLLGFIGSVATGDPDDENTLRNAFLTGSAFAAAGHGARKLTNYHSGKVLAKKSTLEIPGLDLTKDSPVVSKENIPEKVVPITAKIRRVYYQLIRSSGGAEYAVNQTGGTDLPTERNPGKRMFLFGRYIGQTENALTNRLTYEGPNGEPIPIEGVQTPHAILKMVSGDKEGLGNVATALASAEGAGKRKVPMDEVMRSQIIKNAPPEYIAAAKELRKYNLGLMEIMFRNKLISEQGFKEMATEEWYTPLEQILEGLGKIDQQRKDVVSQPTAVHARKGGGKNKVLNPFDTTIDMTARVMRAAEFGRTMNTIVDFAETLPSAVRSAIAEPVHRSLSKSIDDVEKAAAELQKLMKISRSDAENMLTYMHLSNDSMKHGIVNIWRNDKLSAWKINGEFFDAIKSMLPYETHELTKFLAAPARLASKGVVMDPAFVGMQFMVDSMSSFLMSKYGFRPGWDSFRGWWNVVSRSEKYKKMLDMGGPSTIQSLEFANPKSASQTVGLAGKTPWETALHQVKELHPWQAYKTLVMPVAEAARVGEYLRALDHGESTLEAVFAAWDIMGNPRMQGAAPGMRAINMMSMFTRPSLAALDKLVKETGLGPWTPGRDKTWLGRGMEAAGMGPRAAAATGLGVRVFAGITLPSMLLWASQKDDEEVRQLRQTSSNSKYWIIRGPTSQIFRIRKPYVLGEIFGSAVENALDEAYTKDPGQMNAAVHGMIEDAAVNLTPLFGVIPYSLFVNKDITSGRPITPERDSNLPPGIAGYSSASKFGQMVGTAAEPVLDYMPEVIKNAFSPKGVDYVVNSLGSMAGRDFLRLIDGAAQYKESHTLPPMEELPVIASFMSKFPSTNVKELGEFYRWSEQVDNSVKGLAFYLEAKPQKAMDFAETHSQELAMAALVSQTRKQIGDMRRAVDDLRKAPPSIVSIENRKAIEKQMTMQMIELARGANTAALQMGLRK